jgi:hypothetical protein
MKQPEGYNSGIHGLFFSTQFVTGPPGVVFFQLSSKDGPGMLKITTAPGFGCE